MAHLNDELVIQSALPGKINGKIGFLSENGQSGFIIGDDGVYYFFTLKYLVSSTRKEQLYVGREVRFLPTSIMEETVAATEIEVL